MDNLLWIIPILPFAGALILLVFGAKMPKNAAGAIGCISVGASFAAATVLAVHFISASPAGHITYNLYSWIKVNALRIGMGFYLDQLSLVMMLVITFVGFLIHLYASQSMYEEDGYHRFFGYMNLFVGSMLTLVLGSNLLILYLGWEGVGLCSYLLIGFWYKDRNNGFAAQKAFIVTRVGDTAMAIGLFVLFVKFGTLDIQAILKGAPAALTLFGAALVAFLLIGGAVGKSAQVPLQTWLPDAMAGPTPVSALIHAATMVTAGVYLIARMHTIFSLSQTAMLAVAVIGTVTLFYSGFSALVQRDIKRVLAYSTISQIGYMFLALGVGAWAGAVFHFMTHAFFKALLFLSAGIVIDAQHHEHDMFKIGGLKNRLPVAYWTFLIGAASLSALPFITAGFYSKDAIIWASYSSGLGSLWFTVLSALGALITTAYIFRVVFLVFYGEQKMEISKYPGILMRIAVVVLAFFSVTAGFIGLPEVLSKFNPFGAFLSSVFPSQAPRPIAQMHKAEWTLLIAAGIEWIIGVTFAWAYFTRPRWSEAVARSAVGRAVHRFFFAGWGFDWLYGHIFVQSFRAIANLNRKDAVDKVYTGLAAAARCANIGLSYTETGRVRNYAAGIVLGAVVIALIVILR